MFTLLNVAVVIWLACYALGIATNTAGVLWTRRRYIYSVITVLFGFASGLYAASRPSITGAITGFVGLYAPVAAIRVVKSRIEPGYLRQTTRNSLFEFMLWHVLAVTVDWTVSPRLSTYAALTLLSSLSLAASLFWLLQLSKSLAMTQPVDIPLKMADTELPTITVAVPARNETDSLAQCIQSILASDYPKLEILILDDCSQDKTAEVIRSFAHDGVRFVQGTEPPEERWLHKNWAYQTLLDNASGDYVLFMGVDVRLSTGSVRRILALLLHRKLKMISVLPQRVAQKRATSLIQPMRYWWQLALPREALKRPAVLSSCWMVDRKALNKIGGFARTTRTIIPEQHIAREFSVKNGYRFYRSAALLGVTSIKSFNDQLQTAIRTRYPQVRRRPERAMLLTIAELVLLVLPFVLLPLGYFVYLGPSIWVALGSVCLLIAGNVMLARATNPSAAYLSLINFPLIAALEVGLINYSMYQYEFGDVEWKGRNICLPVMRVYSSLPKL